MPVSESQAKARDKYDAANMAYQTVKVPKTLLTAFRQACADRGERVNTVLRQAMQDYIDRDGA